MRRSIRFSDALRKNMKALSPAERAMVLTVVKNLRRARRVALSHGARGKVT